MFTFPTKRSDPERRSKWKGLINRKDRNNKTWTPGKQARVCSKHFPDNQLSSSSLPTLNLGFDSSQVLAKINPPSRRKLSYKHQTPKNKPIDDNGKESPHATDIVEVTSAEEVPSEINDASSNETTRISRFNAYVIPEVLLNFPYLVATLAAFFCVTIKRCMTLSIEVNKLNIIIAALVKKLNNSRKVNKNLKQNVFKLKQKCSKLNRCQCRKPLFESLFSTSDKNVMFFTEIESRKLFMKLYNVVQPYVRRRWKGLHSTSTALKRKFKNIPKRMGPDCILNGKDEFLLCLMKLHLGMLSRDLQYRFNISIASTSRILSWLRACA